MRFFLLLSALFVSLSGLVAGEGVRAGQVVERSVGGALVAAVRSATLQAPHRALIPADPWPADPQIAPRPVAPVVIAGSEARLRV